MGKYQVRQRSYHGPQDTIIWDQTMKIRYVLLKRFVCTNVPDGFTRYDQRMLLLSLSLQFGVSGNEKSIISVNICLFRSAK